MTGAHISDRGYDLGQILDTHMALILASFVTAWQNVIYAYVQQWNA